MHVQKFVPILTFKITDNHVFLNFSSDICRMLVRQALVWNHFPPMAQCHGCACQFGIFWSLQTYSVTCDDPLWWISESSLWGCYIPCDCSQGGIEISVVQLLMKGSTFPIACWPRESKTASWASAFWQSVFLDSTGDSYSRWHLFSE